MENSARMRHLKRAGDLKGDPDDVALWQRTAKRRALDVLEHEVVRADVEDLTNVRMAQRGNRARFLLESPHAIGIGGEGVGQDLEGYVTMKPRVARPIHFSHAPGAKRGHDFIRTETRACCQGHQRGTRDSI